MRQFTDLIDNAVKEYRTATKKQQEILELVYGKDTFKTAIKITERVSCIEDIYEIAGVDPQTMVVTDDMSPREKYAIHNENIRLIAQVLNEGVILSWANKQQKKWMPWFEWNGSAFVFTFSYSYYGFANTALGSRFASEELSTFAARTFPKQYNDFLNAQ